MKIKEKTIAIYFWSVLLFWFVTGILTLSMIAYQSNKTIGIQKRKIETKDQVINYLEEELDNCQKEDLNIN